MKIKTIENEEIIVRCEDNSDVEIISKSTNRNYVVYECVGPIDNSRTDMYVVFDMTDESESPVLVDYVFICGPTEELEDYLDFEVYIKDYEKKLSTSN
jgi:hypothetical protein